MAGAPVLPFGPCGCRVMALLSSAGGGGRPATAALPAGTRRGRGTGTRRGPRESPSSGSARSTLVGTVRGSLHPTPDAPTRPTPSACRAGAGGRLRDKLFWAAILVTALCELLFLRDLLRYGRAESAPAFAQSRLRAGVLLAMGGVFGDMFRSWPWLLLGAVMILWTGGGALLVHRSPAHASQEPARDR
ncbi:hypothetical protein OG562_43770 [Streptomyces sp. NBC_01275]|uniref:hypothetical protein n=1 Tax=Streptomyces sp. NBC_01275 TaxID=2903807 RepID=UPI00224FB590|nr:hypothetical protein [Streptomyces sp. NBC_01275]MCX4767761.1 hypothetical protein [Streptomyces sp. NBC_01275]